jgi:hypothetical protein
MFVLSYFGAELRGYFASRSMSLLIFTASAIEMATTARMNNVVVIIFLPLFLNN